MASEESYLNSSLRKIAKGAGIGFTGTFLGMALGYISRVIIGRWLGASDYGLINLGFAALTIGTTFSLLGLQKGIRRYVSYYKGKNDEQRVKGVILGALKVSFPLSLILSFLFFFNAFWISKNIFNASELTPVLKIFSVGIPFMVLARNLISATVAFQDLRYKVYVNDLFQNIFKLVAVIILLYLGFGVIGASWGWFLAVFLMPFLAFYFLERRVFSILSTKIKAISMDRDLLYFSIPLIFAGMAGVVMRWMDTLMLGFFSGPTEVGIYNASLPTARLLRVFLGSFAAIYLPVISELYAKNAIEDLKSTYIAVTKWIFILVLPAFLLMVLFSERILKIMFGPEYIAGSTALAILSFGFLVICVVGPTGQILQAYGRTRIVMGCSFVGAGINFLLNYILIPFYGVNGAAVATGTSLAAMNIFHLFFVYRIIGTQPFRKSYIKPLLASLTAVFVVYIVAKYIIGISFLSLVAMLFVFVALYTTLLLITKPFEKEDLMIMRSIDQRLGIKTEWIRNIISRFL